MEIAKMDRVARVYILVTSILVILSLAASAFGVDRQTVEAAMAGVAKGEYADLAELKSESEAAVPLLAEYADAKDPKVRAAVVELATGVRTPQSLELLSRLIGDKDEDVAARATAGVFRTFGCDELRRSQELKKNLMARLSNVPNDSRALLLLTCHQADQDVLRFLLAQRESATGLTKLEISHPVVELALAADVALASYGDGASVSRVLKRISAGEIRDLIFIIQAARFLSDPDIRRELVELLHDQRPALPGAPSHTGYFLRVCDLALAALEGRSKVSRYGDNELERAYRALRTPK